MRGDPEKIGRDCAARDAAARDKFSAERESYRAESEAELNAIGIGSHVRWSSGPGYWGVTPRDYEGVVRAIVPRGASAWAMCGGTTRAQRKLTDVVRGFERALVEAVEGGERFFYAPRLNRLSIVCQPEARS